MEPNLSLIKKAEIAREKRVFAECIAKRLKEIRLSKHMTQEQLAYKAGYSRNMVGNFEQAIYSPNAHTVWRLAHALEVDVCEVFKNL